MCSETDRRDLETESSKSATLNSEKPLHPTLTLRLASLSATMASQNIRFGAWMLNLVSGVDKLKVVADATQADLDRWEFSLFKVLEAQGILHHVNKDLSRKPNIFDTSDPFEAEKALVLALLKFTIDESVADRLSYPIDNPRLAYTEIRDGYLEFIEGERGYQTERAEHRIEKRALHMDEKGVPEKEIKEKEKELVGLNDKMVALNKAIEWTYSPEWNDW